MKALLFHSQAREELGQAVAYYETQRRGSGLALQSEIEHCVARIHENPHIGERYKATDFRFRVLQSFPYVVYYLELEHAIWIVAIAHGRRRPAYWKGRHIE